MIGRDEHLAWARRRAHEYLDAGDVRNAVQSMMSDVQKHDETLFTAADVARGLSVIMANDRDLARQFINGFV
jgi:hypothetical protein